MLSSSKTTLIQVSHIGKGQKPFTAHARYEKLAYHTEYTAWIYVHTPYATPFDNTLAAAGNGFRVL